MHILNFSVDSRDASADDVAEDLSFNDIESAYEFIAEAVLGFENAVEEHDECDHDGGSTLEWEKVYLNPQLSYQPVVAFVSDTYHRHHHLQHLSSLSLDIDGPPPRG